MFVREFSLTAAHVRQRGHSEAGPREPERRRHLLRLLHAQDRVRQGKHQPRPTSSPMSCTCMSSG